LTKSVNITSNLDASKSKVVNATINVSL